jgi:hypothetical protein
MTCQKTISNIATSKEIQQVFVASEKVFENFLIQYDIVPGDEQQDIQKVYSCHIQHNKEVCLDNINQLHYQPYLIIFNPHTQFHDQISMIYYFMILYYCKKDILVGFTRYISVQLSQYKLIKSQQIVPLFELQDMTKEQLILVLQDITKTGINFLFMIMSIQMYF